MSTLQRIARVVRMVIENRAVLAAEARAYERIVPAAMGSGPAAHDRHLLLTPPGAGNIGDQAMIQAFIAAVEGGVTLVVRREAERASVAVADRDRVDVVVMPDLVYGLPGTHRRVAREFGELLRTARSFSVVGADIMDGAYWEAPSVRRFRLARIAAELGITSRVLGFSWNAAPARLARREMAAASASVTLLPRDPVSAERLVADGAAAVTLTADMALRTPRSPLPAGPLLDFVERHRADGRRLVVLNSNYLTEAVANTVGVFRDVVTGADPDVAFVALPHDSRSNPSDIDLARRLGEAVGATDRLFVVETLLAPGQVAELAARATLVVTGRMHLALLATSVGTPAVSVGYQGKVGGLYRALGSDTWLEANTRTADLLPALITGSLARADELRARISDPAAHLRDLAGRNFDGLT